MIHLVREIHNITSISITNILWWSLLIHLQIYIHIYPFFFITCSLLLVSSFCALLFYIIFLPLLLKYSFKWTKLCILVLLILSMSYLISTPILLFRPKFRPHSSYFISNSYIIPASVFIPNVNLIPHISFLISTSFLLFNPNRRLVLRTVWHP